MEKIGLITVQRLIPKNSELIFTWKKNVAKSSTVTKSQKLGSFSFKNSLQKFDIVAPISGKIIFLCPGELQIEEERQIGETKICEIAPCTHELIYNGTCTICFETGIKKDTQIIFDRISNVSASDKLVEEKIKEITNKGKKQILILDLDNTVIHARQVPVNFSLEKYYQERTKMKKSDENNQGSLEEFNAYLKKAKENDNLNDYFEICFTKSGKYLVRKRPHLEEFLQ